jgi:hypothetical protein
MSTYTIHPQERHHSATDWTLHHPLIATVAALLAAVLAGVLIGVLFSLVLAGAPAATQHRAGGHALATVAAAQHAAATTIGAARTATSATADDWRSPARGGFAVGRTTGAGSGFIVVKATREPARGGFPGRSLGAGHVPGAALMHATAAR